CGVLEGPRVPVARTSARSISRRTAWSGRISNSGCGRCRRSARCVTAVDSLRGRAYVHGITVTWQLRGVGRLRREARRVTDAVRRVLPDTPEGRDLRAKVAAVPFWWHSIDLGFGVTTPGMKSAEQLAKETAALALPGFAGKTVLDIAPVTASSAYSRKRTAPRASSRATTSPGLSIERRRIATRRTVSGGVCRPKPSIA